MAAYSNDFEFPKDGKWHKHPEFVAGQSVSLESHHSSPIFYSDHADPNAAAAAGDLVGYRTAWPRATDLRFVIISADLWFRTDESRVPSQTARIGVSETD